VTHARVHTLDTGIRTDPAEPQHGLTRHRFLRADQVLRDAGVATLPPVAMSVTIEAQRV
jgi:hypothetical protein